MTKCYIALGSNLGDRKKNLADACSHLQKISASPLMISSLYETPAALPASCPSQWNLPYLNAVIKLSTDLDIHELFKNLKKIEGQFKHDHNQRWAPRSLDLDLLFFAAVEIDNDTLTVPHPRLFDRDFVKKPLWDVLDPNDISQQHLNRLQTKLGLPAWMHILNLSPDSFSDGQPFHAKSIRQQLDTLDEYNIHYLDIGASSTRPNAPAVSATEEINRIEPFLELWQQHVHERIFKPKLSLDSMHAETALWLMENTPLHVINDVSGLSDPMMLEVLQNSRCDYVLMHSLSAPVNPSQIIPEHASPIDFLKQWLDQKLNILLKNNISLNRIIFDPGLGFGKSADQSLQILQNIDAFKNSPCRLLIGHSRKSFMSIFTQKEAALRDPQSLAISLQMAKKGVDILRVHNAPLHHQAWLAFEHVRKPQHLLFE